MRVVMDVREAQLDRVGVSVYCRNLIKEFQKFDDDFHFIFLASDASVDCLKDISAEHIEIKHIAPDASSSIFQKLLWYFKLPYFLNSYNCDLYFGPFIKLPFIDFHCKTVFTLHDAASITQGHTSGNVFNKYLNYIFTRSWIKAVDGIVCISRDCRDEYSRIFGAFIESKSTVIHHGLPKEFEGNTSEAPIDHTKVMKKYGIVGDYIITVGTIYPKKNIERLVRSMALVRKDVTLLVCGSTKKNCESILNAPELYGVGSRVKFLGRVETEDLKSLLSGAEAFVFPTLYEGFGLPVLEAFHSKVPVVCSNVSCLPEVAGEAACYFDPYDVGSIAESVTKVLDDLEYKSMLVRSGSARVTKFSWTKSAMLHKKFFKKVVNKS